MCIRDRFKFTNMKAKVIQMKVLVLKSYYRNLLVKVFRGLKRQAKKCSNKACMKLYLRNVYMRSLYKLKKYCSKKMRKRNVTSAYAAKVERKVLKMWSKAVERKKEHEKILHKLDSVSYTHLTLPTICSV
eukprot:TRINITY_DN19907_c0_g1_i1.p1 TRINITY_DN19907_c0_g1~~TRINITY_DN19907_c0_g1_i1.p1  ORF type:complete len:130 (+),score=23.40 TRINITY_DN19907_c0_g1_i1:74-463(+)